jgi:hypothetical protein
LDFDFSRTQNSMVFKFLSVEFDEHNSKNYDRSIQRLPNTCSINQQKVIYKTMIGYKGINIAL